MAELKRYLDYAGLKSYDEKIKKLIHSDIYGLEAELKSLLARVDKNSVDRDNEILEKIQVIENNIGDMSILGENIKTMAVAIVTEATRAQKVESAILERVEAIENSYVTQSDFSWGTLGQN